MRILLYYPYVLSGTNYEMQNRENKWLKQNNIFTEGTLTKKRLTQKTS